MTELSRNLGPADVDFGAGSGTHFGVDTEVTFRTAPEPSGGAGPRKLGHGKFSSALRTIGCHLAT